MSRRKRLLALTAAALAALSLGLAACGDDDDTTTEAATTAPATTAPATTAPATTAPATTEAAEATELEVNADPSGALAFVQETLTAPAGEITLKLTNDAPVQHNIAVEETVSETVQDGGQAEITVTLPAGTYEYYCEVPGHRQAGMVGTLTVE